MNAVVTFAAVTEHFLMIDGRDDARSLRCMAGLAQVAAGDVGRWLAWIDQHAVVTVDTV